MRNALNQSAAAGQNEPEIESSFQGNDDGVMLDSPQDEENYEDILQLYMPDDEITPNENLEGS